MATTITTRLPGITRFAFLEEIRKLPRYLSGKEPDRNLYGRAFKNTFAHTLFTKIHKAFEAKSAGGRDELGDQWRKLKRETIAQRPLQPGGQKKLGTQYLGRSGRGLLTASQNRKWGAIFRSVFLKLVMTLGEGAAKAQAAKVAWSVLKREGAKTKLQAYGSRQVPIGKVSGRLEASLKPGTLSGSNYTPPLGQILTFNAGSFTMGSEVPYAAAFHKRRRLWPTIRAMKQAGWLQEATRKAVLAVAEKVEHDS